MSLQERLFVILNDRYERILFRHFVNAHGWQDMAFHKSVSEWDELLGQNGIEATTVREEWRMHNGVVRHIRWILHREPEINLVSDPCHELGIRLGLLTTNHRFLKVDGGLALKILVLGDLP